MIDDRYRQALVDSKDNIERLSQEVQKKKHVLNFNLTILSCEMLAGKLCLNLTFLTCKMA